MTTIRDPGGNIKAQFQTRADIESGKRVGPRLFFAGAVLDGPPPVWPGSPVIDTPDEAERTVRSLIDQGVDRIKVYNNITEPVLAAIIRTARAGGIPVTGHVPRTMTMTRAVEMGLDRLEHIRITGRELLSAADADRIDPLPLAVRETLL